jgi:hypothetical protein
MLENGTVATRLPAQDLERAKAFYAGDGPGAPIPRSGFEDYDLPGLKTVDGTADIGGNYPSKGTGERGAWFRDSEGNMLGIGQPVRG